MIEEPQKKDIDGSRTRYLRRGKIFYIFQYKQKAKQKLATTFLHLSNYSCDCSGVLQ